MDSSKRPFGDAVERYGQRKLTTLVVLTTTLPTTVPNLACDIVRDPTPTTVQPWTILSGTPYWNPIIMPIPLSMTMFWLCTSCAHSRVVGEFRTAAVVTKLGTPLPTLPMIAFWFCSVRLLVTCVLEVHELCTLLCRLFVLVLQLFPVR